jgi:hypothetical protein
MVAEPRPFKVDGMRLCSAESAPDELEILPDAIPVRLDTA